MFYGLFRSILYQLKDLFRCFQSRIILEKRLVSQDVKVSYQTMLVFSHVYFFFMCAFAATFRRSALSRMKPVASS